MKRLSPIDFLRHFHRPGEKFFVGAISPHAGGRPPRWWYLDVREIGGRLTEFRAENAKAMGIYFSVASFKTQKRAKEHVSKIRSLWLDFDKPCPASEAFAAGKQWGDLPLPNIISHTSPGKMQCFWLLADGEDAPVIEVEEVEKILRGLTRASGADVMATDITRVLRLPGFENSKYPKFPHVESFLLHGDRTTTLRNFQQFRDLQPPDDFSAFVSSRRGGRAVAKPALTDEECLSLIKEIGPVAREHAKERWARVAQEKSPSEADWAVCGYLAAIGISPAAIEAFLRTHHPGKHDDYYPYTVSKFFSKYGYGEEKER